MSGVILAAGAIAAYSRTFSVPLHFDDLDAIANNPSIRHLSTALWPPINTTASGRPILNLSLAINYAISGTAVWSYHVLNLAIHVMAGLTLLGILRRTLAPLAGPRAARIAFCAALLWALHPLQTESVTYVIQRAESLMGLSYLLTLYCFIRGAGADGRPRLLWFGSCIGACLLGMGTKEVMVSAPLIVLLYDRTFLAGSFAEACRLRWRVYAGLASSWLILPFLVLSTHGRSGTAGFGAGVSWWSYALTQFPTIARYLKLSVWPHPLVFDYGTQWVTDGWAILPSAAVVAGLAAATGWAVLRSGSVGKSLGFAGVWFFAILAPTSLVPGNRQTAAEHRMYLALIPVVALAVIGIHRRSGRAALPVCLGLAGALFGVTLMRNETYRSALDLWADTVAKCPKNAFAHNNLGYELREFPGRIPEAISHYEEALRLKPDLAEAHNNLGNALRQRPGRLNDAIAQYEEALRLNPGLAEAHNDLGNALRQAPGRLNDAIEHYKAALRLKPGLAEAHNNLGVALERTPGRLNDAIAQYEEALQLDPDFAEAHCNLGIVLNAEGRTQEAIAQYEVALRFKPDFAGAHNNLGNALEKTPGRLNDAIVQYGEALRLDPDSAEAHNNLGNALEKMPGRLNDAIAQYGEALRLDPDSAETHDNLGVALGKTPGRLHEAIAQFEEAVRLDPDDAAAHFNLGMALLATSGRTDEAAAHLETVLRLQPGNESARQILARIRAPKP